MLKKLFLIMALLLALPLALAACQPTTPDVREVTRVVTEVQTEIIEREGETQVIEVEVTRIERVVEEVVATPEAPPPTDRRGAWLDTIVIVKEEDYNKAAIRLESGELGLYMFSTSDAEFKAKVDTTPELQSAISFGSNREITFNPTGPVWENGNLNPFSVPRIRAAMNMLVDREYIAEELYSGTVVPRWTVIGTATPDYGKLAAVARRIEAEYAYDKDRAAAIIAEEMEALGAELVNGVWTYEGEPVELIFIIRVEWGRPQGDYLANQLEDIGFTVVRDYKNAAEAGPVWLTGDPNLGQWHLYTGGWGATGLSRDASWTPGFFHMPFGRSESLWQNYDPDPDFYDVAEILWNSTYTNLEERDELFEQALVGAIEDSVRIFLFDEKGFTAFRTETSVSVDLAAGVVGSNLWPYTLRHADREGGSMTVAMPSILTQPMNPPDGSNWTYDQAISRATGDSATVLDPSTGLAWPQRVERMEIQVAEGLPVGVTLDWVTLDFAPEIAVPDDAWVAWDAENQVFLTAGEVYTETVTANSKRTVYYPADLYDTHTWHDGSAFSFGDVLLNMILTFDRANEASEIFDAAKVPAFNTFMGAFRGVRVVSTDPLVIETWSDSIELDAELMISSWWPYYGHGAGSWHALTLGILAEQNLLSTFTDAKANANNVDRLNYVTGPTVAILKDQLDEAIEMNFLPYEPTFSQYVDAAEVESRYANIADWYDRRGHFWVGNGVYYIERAFPVEQMVVLQRYLDYDRPADRWARFAAPAIAEVEVDGPDRITQGAPVSFDVFVDYAGSPYAASDVEEVKYLIFDATGALVLVGDAEAVADGTWEVNLTGEETAALQAGAGKIEIVVISRLVALPSFDALQFVVAP
jgi:peptide/nickel transport system substrate-binding protein